eukprot:scaffold221147_cov22-Tisochrysis_lutea.AAC.1
MKVALESGTSTLEEEDQRTRKDTLVKKSRPGSLSISRKLSLVYNASGPEILHKLAQIQRVI